MHRKRTQLQLSRPLTPRSRGELQFSVHLARETDRFGRSHPFSGPTLEAPSSPALGGGDGPGASPHLPQDKGIYCEAEAPPRILFATLLARFQSRRASMDPLETSGVEESHGHDEERAQEARPAETAKHVEEPIFAQRHFFSLLCCKFIELIYMARNTQPTSIWTDFASVR